MLDDLKKIKQIDKSEMAFYLRNFPDECLRALEKAKNINMPQDYQKSKNIIICGMGGSAISGDLLRGLTFNILKIPLFVNRSPILPNWVDENSLVILISYSGKTKETLSCFKQARKRKAKIISLASAGDLEKLSKKNKLPIFKIDLSSPPRAALSWLFIPLLIILEKLDWINIKNWPISKELKLLWQFNKKFFPETPAEKNPAKYLAYLSFDRIPIIISETNLSGVSKRWMTQFNENSKNFAFFATIPEIFHNMVEGIFPWEKKENFIFLILENPGLDKFKKEVFLFKKLLDQINIKWETIICFGKKPFLQLLSLVLIGDWLSYYLAILNKIDPSPVEKINFIKKKAAPRNPGRAFFE